MIITANMLTRSRLDFIISPIYLTAVEKIAAARRVIAIAEQATAARQSEVLSHASELVHQLELPRRYEAVSQYYSALAIEDFGKGNETVALNLIETLSEQGPIFTKARAWLSAGNILARRGKIDEARKLYTESAQAGALIGDHYLSFLSSMNMAVIASVEGDHRGSLRLLETELPRAAWVRRFNPVAYLNFINGLAVEKSEAGYFEEALNLIQAPLASPYVFAYPEWTETRAEIKVRGQRASHSRVFIDKVLEPDNVRRLVPRPKEDEAHHAPIGAAPSVTSLLDWKAEMAKGEKKKEEQTIAEKEKEALHRIIDTELTHEQLDRILKILRDAESKDQQS